MICLCLAVASLKNRIHLRPHSDDTIDKTGPSGAKRGILVIYDVFGLYVQALKGADILGYDYDEQPDNAGEFQVFMPDWFGDHPQDMANFPPKNPKQFKAIMDFMHGHGDPARTVPLIAPLMADVRKRHPEIESFSILGFCWGGKIASLVCQEGTIFKAAAQCHPSMLDTEDAKKVTVPMCILPSQDEVPEVSSYLLLPVLH
jgi:dienelactone hydrolase